MKKWILVIVVCALITGQMPGQADRPLSGLQSRYAVAELKGMSTDQRISFLQQKVKAQPRDIETQGLLAAAMLQKLRETIDPVYLQHASAVVDQMLSIDAKNYSALRLENEIDMQRHDFLRVAARARELLERNPSDSGTAGLLGDALMEMGKYSDAIEVYQRMTELSPNLSSYNRLAYHSFITGNQGDALAWMYQAVRAGADSPENRAWCLVEFGDLLFKTGHVEDAKAAYSQALAAFPGYHRGHAALGRLLASEGDYKEAIDHLKQAQASVPLPEYAALLAALYRRTDQARDADRELQLIDTVDKLMAVNGETMNRNLAVIFADQDRKLDRALQLAQAEFKVRNDVYTYDALGWVQYKRKEYSEAAAASQKAILNKTPDPLLYYHAGMIQAALGDRKAASRYLQQALSLNPKFDFRFAEESRRTLDLVSQARPAE